MFKFVVFAAAIAATQAVLAPTPYGGTIVSPTVVGQQSNILRSYGNLGQVSTYSKTIDTPFSSVSKSDVRVSNPGVYSSLHSPLAVAHAPLAAPWGVPSLAHAPVAAPWGAPTVAHAPVAAPWGVPAKLGVAPAGSLLGVAYSPAVAVSHMSYQAPAISYAW